MTPRSLLGAALRYAASGWRVFPVSADKSPLTAHGFKDASADERLIQQWWDTTPTANIGLAIPEGLVVLDFDPRNGAPHPYNDLSLPHTRTVGTPGGGWHLYYGIDDGESFAGTWMQGVDVKAP